MGTCRHRFRAYAHAGEGTVRWIKCRILTNRRGPLASSGRAPCVFLEPDDQHCISLGRSVAKAGERGMTIPPPYANTYRRKTDVYDLCLMIDLATEQE